MVMVMVIMMRVHEKPTTFLRRNRTKCHIELSVHLMIYFEVRSLVRCGCGSESLETTIRAENQ